MLLKRLRLELLTVWRVMMILKTEPEADLIDMEEKELTGVVDELNIGNAKKARLNCSMKLESC